MFRKAEDNGPDAKRFVPLAAKGVRILSVWHEEDRLCVRTRVSGRYMEFITRPAVIAMDAPLAA